MFGLTTISLVILYTGFIFLFQIVNSILSQLLAQRSALIRALIAIILLPESLDAESLD